MMRIRYNLPKNTLFLSLFFMLAFSLSAQKSAKSYYDDGMLSLNIQNYYDAAELFKSALTINPNYTDAIIGSASAYFFLGEYQESLNLLNRYDALTRSIEAKTLRGRALAALGQRDQAVIIFNEVLKSEPNNLDAQFGMAEVYLLSGKSDLAIRNIKNLLNLIPDNRRALLSLAVLYDDELNFTAAEPHIIQALFYYPQDPLVLMMAANHYKKQRNFTKSLQYYDAVSSIAPNYGNLAENKAEALLGLGKYDEAAAVLEELIRGAGRSNAKIWATLAAIFERQGNYDMALQCYNEALRLEPNAELTRFAAEDLVRTHYRPNSPERLYYANERLKIGDKYKKAYNNQRALREYRQALLLAPDDAKIRYTFGRLLNEQGGHFSFIDQLTLIKNKGDATQQMLDVLEMEVSRSRQSVAKEWRFPNGPLGEPTKLYVATIKNQSQVTQVDSERLLNRAFINYLERFTRIDSTYGGEKNDFTHAWREARSSGSDFFIINRYIEKNRSFFAEYRLYLTSTGSEISTYATNRSSASKIDEAFTLLSNQLEQTLPLKLKIIRREGKMALASGGHFNGLKRGDEFVVVRAGRGRFVSNEPYFEYLFQDELGRFIVTKTDEYVSEGELRVTKSPDIIAQEDELFLIKADVMAPKPVEPVTGIPDGFLLIH